MTQEQQIPEKVDETSSTPSKLKIAWILNFAILLAVVVLLTLLESNYTNLSEKGWTTYTDEDSGLVYDSVLALAIDAGGRFWVGTFDGLSVLTPDGSWTTYTSEDSGLVDNHVYALAIDEGGRAWAGTSGGLSVLAPDGSWTTYTSEDSGLVHNDVHAMAIDDGGRVWVGTRGGLSVLAPGGSWTTYTLEDLGLASSQVWALAIDERGRVWAGTGIFTAGRHNGDLIVFAPDGSWTTYTSEGSGLVGGSVRALAIDEGGRVWVGTTDGLSVLAPDGSWTTYTSEDSGLTSNIVSALAIDEGGRVWVGALYSSVLAPDGSWTTYTSEKSGLVGDSVSALAIDEAGHVWMGTRGGLNRFDEGASTSKSTMQPKTTANTLLRLLSTLAASSLVIVTIGIIRLRRKLSKAPALMDQPWIRGGVTGALLYFSAIIILDFVSRFQGWYWNRLPDWVYDALLSPGSRILGINSSMTSLFRDGDVRLVGLFSSIPFFILGALFALPKSKGSLHTILRIVRIGLAVFLFGWYSILILMSIGFH